MGGEIVATGTPEEIIKVKNSYTGQFLKEKIINSTYVEFFINN